MTTSVADLSAYYGESVAVVRGARSQPDGPRLIVLRQAVAAGPYCPSSSLDFTPLVELVDAVIAKPVDVLVLVCCG